MLLNTAKTGIISVVIFAVITGQYDIKKLVLYFISFVALCFGIDLLTIFLKKIKEIDDKIYKE